MRGSRPTVGSSRNSTRGSDTSARAISRRRRWPPLYPSAVRSSSSASRNGDFDALVAVLDPDVVFRIDVGGAGPRAHEPVAGAAAVAQQVLTRGSPFARFARPAIVNGAPGVVVAPGGRPLAVVGFTSAQGRIVEIDALASATVWAAGL